MAILALRADSGILDGPFRPDALSPLDGRYAASRGAGARLLFSEAGLMRERVRVEAPGSCALARVPRLRAARRRCRRAALELRRRAGARSRRTDAAGAIKQIESRTNHDVKAVEYLRARRAGGRGAERRARWSWCISAAPRKTSTISATR